MMDFISLFYSSTLCDIVKVIINAYHIKLNYAHLK